MKNRLLSVLLSLALVVSTLVGITPVQDAYAAVAASSLSYNSGHRDTIATELSDQAKAYYTGEYTYDKLDAKSSTELFNALDKLMDSTMTDSVSYDSLTSYWRYTDAEDGTAGTIIFYSDEQSESFNREHVWPKSNGSFFKINAGCDLHHLRPTDTNVNSTRSSYTMGNVRTTSSSYTTVTYGKKTVGWIGNGMFEPLDNVKGDVARIFLYVYTKWNQPNLFVNDSSAPLDTDDSKNNGVKVIESLLTLLEWNYEDPVDTWEMSRNDLIQQVQGNRNVFIDYPELAWDLFGLEAPEDIVTPTSGNTVVKQYEGGVDNSTLPEVNTDITSTPAPAVNLVEYTVPAGEYVVVNNAAGMALSVETKSNYYRAATSYTKNSTADEKVTWTIVDNGDGTVSFKNGENLLSVSDNYNNATLNEANSKWIVKGDGNGLFYFENAKKTGSFLKYDSKYADFTTVAFSASDSSAFAMKLLKAADNTQVTGTPVNGETPSPAVTETPTQGPTEPAVTETPTQGPTEPAVTETPVKEGAYNLVASVDEVTDGQYVFVAKVGDKYYAMSTETNNKNTRPAVEVTVEGNAVVAPAEAVIWKVAKTDKGYTISTVDGLYLSMSNDNNKPFAKTNIANPDAYSYYTVSANGEDGALYFLNEKNGRAISAYVTDDGNVGDFRGYNPETSKAIQKLYAYKLVEAAAPISTPTPEPTEPAVSPEPTEPAAEPTEPAVSPEPTEPAAEPTEPAVSPEPTEPATETGFSLVSSVDEVSDGKYVFVAKVGDKYFAMSTDSNNKNTRVAVEVTVEGNKVVAPADAVIWTVTKTDKGYTIATAEGLYLSMNNSKNNKPFAKTNIATPDDYSYYTVSANGEDGAIYFVNEKNEGRAISAYVTNNTVADFRGYIPATSGSIQKLYAYKLVQAVPTTTTDPEPTEPAVSPEPTEPAAEPTEPAVSPEPTEPAAEPTEPAVSPEPTEPAAEPTEPAVSPEPTEPAAEPTEPAISPEPTEPAAEPEVQVFEPVTSIDDIEEGYYVLYGVKNSRGGALGTSLSKGRIKAVDFDLNNGKIVDPAAAIVWKLVKVEVPTRAITANYYYTLYNEASEKYLVINDSKGTSAFELSDTPTYGYNVVEKDGELLLVTTAGTGRMITFNAANSDFRTYDSANNVSAVTLYKLTEKAAEPTTDPTTEPEPEVSPEPTEPAAEPTEPAAEPTEPAAEPTEPAAEPTEPAAEPTEPAAEPTEPAAEPTEPATEPVQGGEEEVIDDPEIPQNDPTEPEVSPEPTAPATEPEVSPEPTAPAEEKEEPTEVPTETPAEEKEEEPTQVPTQTPAEEAEVIDEPVIPQNDPVVPQTGDKKRLRLLLADTALMLAVAVLLQKKRK